LLPAEIAARVLNAARLRRAVTRGSARGARRLRATASAVTAAAAAASARIISGRLGTRAQNEKEDRKQDAHARANSAHARVGVKPPSQTRVIAHRCPRTERAAQHSCA
jgi:hypothetical protein